MSNRVSEATDVLEAKSPEDTVILLKHLLSELQACYKLGLPHTHHCINGCKGRAGRYVAYSGAQCGMCIKKDMNQLLLNFGMNEPLAIALTSEISSGVITSYHSSLNIFEWLEDEWPATPDNTSSDPIETSEIQRGTKGEAAEKPASASCYLDWSVGNEKPAPKS